MKAEFDPYLQWLGIRDPRRPPNAYRLLGLELFEADPDVIQSAADRQMAHLRTFQHGSHVEQSQQLLNEVAAARVLLLDAGRKAAYDETLHAEIAFATPLPAAPEEHSPPQSLHPPGRGRGERPWYFWVGLASPMLLIAVTAVGYRAIRGYHLSRATERVAASQTTSSLDLSTESSDGATEEPADGGATAEKSAADDASSDPAGTDQTPSDDAQADEVRADQTGKNETGKNGTGADEAAAPGTAAPGSAAQTESLVDGDVSGGDPSSGSEQSQAVRSANDPETWVDRFTDDRLRRWEDLPPWRADPMHASPAEPLGRLLSALGQRDPDAARRVLQQMRNNPALAIQASQLADAELLIASVDVFWKAVRQASLTLNTGDQMEYRRMAVRVRLVESDRVELASPAGEVRTFSLSLSELDLPLAVALAQRYWSPSQPVAWRMAATVVSVDREGTAQEANDYALLAEQAGLESDYLLRAVRRLQGLPELPVPPVVRDALEPLAGDEVRSEGDLGGVPDRDAQRTARREVLSPLMKTLREQQVPQEQQAARLLDRANNAETDAAVAYVLLKTSLSRAIVASDLDTAWGAIDRLGRDFGEDASQLRHRALERVARRQKGESRRRYVERADELAEAAILQDDYENASRFATLALEIARPLADAAYAEYLMQRKKDVLAIQDAYRRLADTRELVKRDPSDPWAQADLAAFEILTKGDFMALARFRDLAGPGLKQQIEREQSVGRLPSHRIELGMQWVEFAEQLDGLQKRNALRRAKYWLNAAGDDLTAEEGTLVRSLLDDIEQVIGRKSDRIDLTSLTPLDHRVGFGSLGVNRNPDAGTGRTQPLPAISGQSPSRYFWACAPSSIRFAIPAQARKFEAIGLLNAASQDGVRFLVLANDQLVYQSPVVTSAGSLVEVAADLPRDTATLELKVDAGNNPVNDHAYWIAPVLLIR